MPEPAGDADSSTTTCPRGHVVAVADLTTRDGLWVCPVCDATDKVWKRPAGEDDDEVAPGVAGPPAGVGVGGAGVGGASEAGVGGAGVGGAGVSEAGVGGAGVSGAGAGSGGAEAPMAAGLAGWSGVVGTGGAPAAEPAAASVAAAVNPVAGLAGSSGVVAAGPEPIGGNGAPSAGTPEPSRRLSRSHPLRSPILLIAVSVAVTLASSCFFAVEAIQLSDAGDVGGSARVIGTILASTGNLVLVIAVLWIVLLLSRGPRA